MSYLKFWFNRKCARDEIHVSHSFLCPSSLKGMNWPFHLWSYLYSCRHHGPFSSCSQGQCGNDLASRAHSTPTGRGAEM